MSSSYEGSKTFQEATQRNEREFNVIALKTINKNKSQFLDRKNSPVSPLSNCITVAILVFNVVLQRLCHRRRIYVVTHSLQR